MKLKFEISDNVNESLTNLLPMSIILRVPEHIPTRPSTKRDSTYSATPGANNSARFEPMFPVIIKKIQYLCFVVEQTRFLWPKAEVDLI